MKNLIFIILLLSFLTYPAKAVTTKMFKVLDACARYTIGEINANEAMEKLKLKPVISSEAKTKDLVSKYCSVFTPNDKIEF